MAYIKDTYELGEYMAYEYKFVGRNGAKGEKREKRKGKRYEENSTCDHGSRNRQQIWKGNQAA